MLDRLLEAIREYYDRGAALPPKMHDKLNEAFEYRDKLLQLFSVQLEDSPIKMKKSLENAGYTLEEIKKLKRYASGNDVFVVDAYIYALEDKRDEFFLASATYYRTISSDELESGEAMFGSTAVAKMAICASKLIDRGYSKENVTDAINSYSETGEIDISKLGPKIGTGVKVRIVPSLQNDKDSKLEENKAALFDAFPDLKALAVSLRGVNSDASAGGTSEPFSVQGENDGVTYMTVDPTAPVNFVPGSAPYYPERKKIREKRKRRLPIFDVSKLKMKMAKAFLKLMKIDSDELGNEGPKKGK